ncbi:MAG: PKD domain-containing protein [Chitinophagaceae bacterium]
MKQRIIQLILTVLIIASAASPVSAQVIAGFASDTVQGCAPLVVRFADRSTGSPVSWKWDLGNGTVSFNQNSSTTYFNPGIYTVKLVVRNANNQADSITKTQFITVYATPVVNFKSSDTTGCFPLKVQFTDLSIPGSGNITNWEWDFGDGSTSTDPNPTHIYTALGNYNVSLRIKNTNGCITTLSKQQYIKLPNGVKADFSFTAPNSCRPPTNINFSNQSSGTGTLNYRWSFGDGSTSTQSNPSINYNNSGSFSVKLIVQNNFGCRDSLEKPDAIVVGTVDANFTIPAEICAGAMLPISNTSFPAPSGALWRFGDGNTATAINPVKSYNIPGSYTITLVSDFGACKDSISKPIKVSPRPSPAFTALNNQSCKAPLTVTFTNTSLDGVSYKWLFGDGSSATGPNQTHTYQKTGQYDVSLIITGANGCSDTLRKTGFVNVNPPKVTLENLPLEGCVPLSFTPKVQVVSLEPLSSYRWDFGDGNSSTAPSPTHLYTTPGIYTVKLTFSTPGGCTDSVTYLNSIKVGTKPQAKFIADPRNACAFHAIKFTDLSTGSTITEWTWRFGDGGISKEKNPAHLYRDTGSFTVTLIVSNNGCKDSLVIPDYIYIKPPIALFTDSTECIDPFNRKFKDLSIGASSWFWSFGDGTNSTMQHPQHTFSKPGNYLVSLTVTNDTCENTITRQVVIVAEKPDFTASDTVLCKGTNVIFQVNNLNANNIAQQTWLFGDGFTSGTLNNAPHSYNVSGIFTVQLVLVDINGCRDTLTKPNYIKVSGPKANFLSTPTNACIEASVTFTDLSSSDGTNPITKWNWKYGDGSSETLTSPPFEHKYGIPGLKTVQLIITDSKGCTDSVSKSGSLFISKPLAGFSSPDSNSCSNKIIRFLNQSAGTSLNYTWNFGDGAPTSALLNPSHNYSEEGGFDISLKVIDRYGCVDSVSKPQLIKIRNPKPAFTVNDSVATCPPLVTSFKNQSENYIAYEWNFGDGTRSSVDNPTHFYNSPGTYIANLIVTSVGGCKDSLRKDMVVRGPQGDFSYDKTIGCNPVKMNFKATTKDNVSFVWDFNDGSTSATSDAEVSHIYSVTGRFVPKMILIDPMGCKVPILGRDTIQVLGVSSKFIVDKKQLCDSGMVIFKDSSVSNDQITSYSWNFGDGATSTQREPVHYYKKPGVYPIDLAVTTQFGCTDTANLATPVQVVQSPVINITGDSAACEPAPLSFSGEVLGSDTARLQWLWNFGNGQRSDSQNPASVLYTTASSYTISSIAVNSSGCADTSFKKVIIHPIPLLDAGNNVVICREESYTLKGLANNYSWSPSQQVSCTNCPNPVARPLNTTTFILSTTSIFGCKAQDSVIIEVKQPFKMSASAGDTICIGNAVNLFASGADGYRWSPSSGLDSVTSPKPRVRPGSTTTYRVIGSDNKNCFSDTAYVPIIVYPYPSVEAGDNKTVMVGSSVTLKPKISEDVKNIKWLPASGLNCNNCAEPVASPRQTTSYSIEVSNQGGCLVKDEVTVYVVCKEGNLYMPNTFSPNGDGNNDQFYPRGKGIYGIKSFKIFNRWGEMVFERYNIQANSSEAGWNGKHKGVDAGQDVYVYLIEVVCENSSVLAFKGNITLIR